MYTAEQRKKLLKSFKDFASNDDLRCVGRLKSLYETWNRNEKQGTKKLTFIEIVRQAHKKLVEQTKEEEGKEKEEE